MLQHHSVPLAQPDELGRPSYEYQMRMLELLPETNGNILAIKASGVLTVADEDDLAPKLEDIFESLSEKERLRAFVDYVELEGFEPGVKTAGLSFELRHRGLVERIAFICGTDLRDEVTRTADIFKTAQVRRFDPASRGTAWTWLKSE
jgi:glycine/D-amino acid oxidase-like deaminating enzyme